MAGSLPELDLRSPLARGLAAWWPLRPAGGSTLYDLGPSRRYSGTLVGTAQWQPGPLGPQLGGFGSGTSATGYVTLPATPQVVAVYPSWVVVGLIHSATSANANQWVWSAGNAIGGNVLVGVRNNDTANNNLSYFVRNASGTLAEASGTGLGTGDGRPHVVAGVSLTASDHRLYVDGRLRASSSTNVGSLTHNLLTLGCIGRSTYSNPTEATIWHASMGTGAVPDMQALAEALLGGGLAFASPPAGRIVVVFGGPASGGGGATGAASLSGSGSLAATGQTEAFGAAALSGAGSLTATGQAEAFGVASLSGTGSLSASGQASAFGVASLAGAGALTVIASVEAFGAATLEGTGSLVASGSATTPGSGSAALEGVGSLSATGQAEAFGAASLAGVGALAATASVEAIASAALFGTGSLSATGQATAPGASGSASLAGSGSLAATGTAEAIATASLSGAGSLSVTAIAGAFGAASLSGSGSLVASGSDTTLPVHTTFSVTSSPGGIRGVSSAPARFSGVSSSPQ